MATTAQFAKFKTRYRQITGEDYREPENLRGELYVPGVRGDDLISVNPFDDWLYWVNLRLRTFVRKRTNNRLLRGLLFCSIYGAPLWLLIPLATAARLDRGHIAMWRSLIAVYFWGALACYPVAHGVGMITRWIRELRRRRG